MVQRLFFRNFRCLLYNYSKVRYELTLIIKHDQNISIHVVTWHRCSKTHWFYSFSLEVCYIDFLTVSGVRTVIKTDLLEISALELSL